MSLGLEIKDATIIEPPKNIRTNISSYAFLCYNERYFIFRELLHEEYEEYVNKKKPIYSIKDKKFIKILSVATKDEALAVVDSFWASFLINFP